MNNEKKKIFSKNKEKIMIKIFIFISLLLIINLNSKYLLSKQIKVCICTPAKEENLYIREFIEHYRKYGVDKIFVLDNNDIINGEKFEEVIDDYIKSGLVTIMNFRGYSKAGVQMMDDCYQKNYLKYDWLIFYDVDEYIYLKDFNNIKDYLRNKIFKKCQRIQLNWIVYTDNNLLYYDNRSIVERFTEKQKMARGVKFGGKQYIKSIIKGHIPNIIINNMHTLNEKLKSCDGFGNPKNVTGIITEKSDFEYYYIKHYYSKSTEEFINKINKGDVFYSKNEIMMHRIEKYFNVSTITIEKINLIQNRTGLNLTKFECQLKKHN